MRIGIVADIHANLPAFVRVLSRLKELGATDTLWCLGDVVGYGPYPNECLDLLREYNHVCLPGNHDWGVIGRAERVLFNDAAGFVIDWTAKQLTPDNRAYLEALTPVLTPADQPFTLLHASPRDPIWEYIRDAHDATVCFPFFKTPYCLVGHTHVPAVFRQDADGIVHPSEPEADEALHPGPDRLIINPGSVGQPRNGDPRAHYAVLDTDENLLFFERVEYPLVLTQARMREYDFPLRLIHRLETGV
jgi:predicted phosphodiesterase